MKIIQSFWSGNKKDFTNSYGWHSYKFNWISWALSCHQLVKYHKDVELYTDKFGYEILIEQLKLPYTKVHVVLDELNNYQQDLWAIAKIKTFQLQTEPFIHVDGDVFVWESLTDKFEKSNLVTQNLEVTTDYYRQGWKKILPYLDFLPKEMNDFNQNKNNYAYNMGIIGGTNINFINEYTKKSIEFVNKNKNSWNQIKSFNFNIFFEQVLFYELSKQQNQKVDVLIQDTPNDDGYVGFGDFDKVPIKKYLHLLGSYKINLIICSAMETYTMRNYPDTYSKIAKLINELNQNNDEIDFLNSNKVELFINNFENELKSSKFLKENYLLKRNLYNLTLPNKLDFFIHKKLKFNIVKLDGVEKESIKGKDETLNVLNISELNNEVRIYDLDQIDEIILEELLNPIQYETFIDKMATYFEDEDETAKEEFLFLINNRIRNYIILKIISIYQ